MALCPIGIKHHRSISNSSSTAKILSGRYRLLPQVGRSQSPGHHHGKEHAKLLWKNIICRYGILRVLVSDNGKQFDNEAFRDFCSQLGIKNHCSSPAHPQANGQVKVMNWSFLKIIKTQLKGEKGIYSEELPSVLWAYRMTVRTPIGEIPFRQAYESKSVIPVEVGLTNYRVRNHDESKNDEAMRLQLDLDNEVRAMVEQRFARY